MSAPQEGERWDASVETRVRDGESRRLDALGAYFERIPTPAYIWRREEEDFVLVRANAAGMERSGGAVRRLVGSRALKVYADRPDIVADLRRAVAGQTFKREMTYLPVTGGPKQEVVVTYVAMPGASVAVHVEDVTERRRVVEELRESHETVRGILEASTQPIMLLDSEGTVLEMNRALARSLRKAPRDVLGRSVFEHFPPEAADERREMLRRAVETGRPLRFEDRRFGRAFHHRLYPVVEGEGAEGGVKRVVVFSEDVTEELDAREALGRSRGLLTQAQRIAHLGHFEWRADSDEVTRSEEIYRIFGVAPEDLPPTYEGFLERVHPDDRDRVRADIESALSHGGGYSLYYRTQRPDGTVRTLHERAQIHRDEDGAVRLVGTTLDVTELREAEEAVRQREADLFALIDGNADGMCVSGPDGILLANAPLTRLLGVENDIIIGRRISDFLAPDQRAVARQRKERLVEGWRGEPHEYTMMRADGTAVPVEIFSAGVTFRGKPAIISTIRDVSRRHRAERELADSRDLLRALTQHLEHVREEERARVARDLHDELGSVLTALKIDLSELEAREPQGFDSARLAGMMELVDEAIGIGRRVTASLRPGILDDLGLAAAVEWLGEDLRRRTGIPCTVERPDAEVRLSDLVATTLFRVLQETLTNVVRHADAANVHIDLTVAEHHVSLTVTDDGVGFDVSTTPEGRFGIVGMRERVRALGGSLEILTAPGEGATVRTSVPVTA